MESAPGREFRRFFRISGGRTRDSEAIDLELAFHLTHREEDLMADGMGRDESGPAVVFFNSTIHSADREVLSESQVRRDYCCAGLTETVVRPLSSAHICVCASLSRHHVVNST